LEHTPHLERIVRVFDVPPDILLRRITDANEIDSGNVVMEGSRAGSSWERVSSGASSAVLDGVVVELREIQRRSGIERTLSVGELILGHFFGGDASLWRDRRKNKANSIRRLAERADCPFCKSALNEAVAVYVASLTLPFVRTFGHIGGSHVAAVLHLSEREREDLLRRAEAEHMRVREFRRLVASLRRDDGERRGRPVSSPAKRAALAIRTGEEQVLRGIEQLKGAAPLADATRQRLRLLAGELMKLACGIDTESRPVVASTEREDDPSSRRCA
jgi:hypothetical protein